MRVHVATVVLRRIRSVRVLPRYALLILVRALIVRKVNYCNSLLAGMSVQLHDRLQSVLNAAARVIFTTRRTDHISPLLRDLHWLRVPERVKFKLCVLTYWCLHGTAPPYLADNLFLTSADNNRRHLRSADSPTLVSCRVERHRMRKRLKRVLSCAFIMTRSTDLSLMRV